MGRAVVQLVEALRHKTGGPAVDLRCGQWKFHVTHTHTHAHEHKRTQNYVILIAWTRQ